MEKSLRDNEMKFIQTANKGGYEEITNKFEPYN